MAERRKSPRYQVLREGRISAGPLKEILCTIRNLSVGGVQILLHEPIPLPDAVDVLLSSEGLYYPARISWRRRGGLIGLEFCSKPERRDNFTPPQVLVVNENVGSNDELAFRIRKLIYRPLFMGSNRRDKQSVAKI